MIECANQSDVDEEKKKLGGGDFGSTRRKARLGFFFKQTQKRVITGVFRTQLRS